MASFIKSTTVTFAVFCFSIIGGLLVSNQVDALSSKAPDTNSGGGYGTSNSRFVLERTGQNTVTSIQVPVYLPNKPTGAVSMSAVDFYYPWSSNQPKVSFQGGPYVSTTRNFTIPAGSFAEDVTTGYWKAFATAQLESVGVSTYNVAEFRLRVNVNGGLIGIGGGKRYSTIPQNYYTTNNNNTYNYNIPFATPCNVSSNTIKSIALDDLDSGTDDNRWNTITVRVYDETAGAYVGLSQVSGSSMSGDYKANMTFKPGHKYRLRINNVHANNTLMYTFPYDNIAYKVGCAWNLLGINSQNRVQTGGTGGFSSYGNYHQGSPRTVRPGDVVQFQHEVKNSGNMKTSTFSRWRARSGWQGTSGWPQSGGTFQSTLNAGQATRWPGEPTRYKIQASDVGRTLCERYSVRGQSSTNGNTYNSVGSCVRVVAAFDLKPAITGFSGSTSPGATIAVRPAVTNQVPSPGATTDTPNTIKWQLSKFTLAPNATKPADVLGAPNATAPCTYFSNSCVSVDDGTRVFRAGVNALTPRLDEKVDSNLPLGAQVCYGLSVSPPTSTASASSWRHISVCITVNKRPTIQVWGGDLRARSINAGTSVGVMGASPAIYGSWAEYGVFARTANNDMASGSGLVGGLSSGALQSAYHKYTFANTGAGGYGNFDFTEAANLAAQFTSVAPTTTPSAGATINVNALASGVHRPTGDITLSSANLTAGKSVIINATGRTVTISGDLEYANGPYSSVGQIPQLVIIAKNIYIRDSVKRIDAWLLANTQIDTCSNVGVAGAWPSSGRTLKQGVCASTLIVNGPVATTKLVLKRTGGAEPGEKRDEPAELFKLRSDAYMWLNSYSGQRAQAWTTGTSGMPARY